MEETVDRKHSTNASHNHANNHESAHTPSHKRKSSSSARDASPTNNNDEDGKKKRRKVNHACVYCRRSHMTCDLERPCARCVKRDIGHLCHDEPREPPKRSKSEIGMPEIAPAPDADGQIKQEMPSIGSVSFASGNGDLGLDGGGPPLAQPTPVSPSQLQGVAPTATTNNASSFLRNFDWNNNIVHNQFQDMHHLHPNYMFNTSEVTNEYNLLNDFLSSSLLDDGGMYTTDDAQALFNDPLLATSSVNALSSNFQPPPSGFIGEANQQHAQPQTQPTLAVPSQSKAGEEISRPSSAFPASESVRNKFYMTAADPAGSSSAGDRLHKLLKAKYEAGMLKPFNYVKGYSRLNGYMSKHLSRESQVRILKQLDRFRPKFREAMQSLNDMQLVLVEMWFERSLMEYDRVFASMAIPACCWRRTGEIYRGNREMAELIGVPWEKLRDGKLSIHEIMIEDSLVSYWEKFGAIAFDQTQKAILTSCSLKHPSPVGESGDGAGRKGGAKNGHRDEQRREITKCSFSFTIRRDTHNIPCLIVGNFLPVRPREKK